MTIIQISKDTIIKALQKEPLKQGYWIKSFNPKIKQKDKLKNKKCYVCAVGSILRNVLDSNNTFETFDKAAREATRNYYISVTPKSTIDNQLNDKEYLSALSIYFESLEGNKNKRRAVIKFVKDNFPDQVQVDINGAIPKRNIKKVNNMGFEI